MKKAYIMCFPLHNVMANTLILDFVQIMIKFVAHRNFARNWLRFQETCHI